MSADKLGLDWLELDRGEVEPTNEILFPLVIPIAMSHDLTPNGEIIDYGAEIAKYIMWKNAFFHPIKRQTYIIADCNSFISAFDRNREAQSMGKVSELLAKVQAVETSHQKVKDMLTEKYQAIGDQNPETKAQGTLDSIFSNLIQIIPSVNSYGRDVIQSLMRSVSPIKSPSIANNQFFTSQSIEDKPVKFQSYYGSVDPNNAARSYFLIQDNIDFFEKIEELLLDFKNDLTVAVLETENELGKLVGDFIANNNKDKIIQPQLQAYLTCEKDSNGFTRRNVEELRVTAEKSRVDWMGIIPERYKKMDLGINGLTYEDNLYLWKGELYTQKGYEFMKKISDLVDYLKLNEVDRYNLTYTDDNTGGVFSHEFYKKFVQKITEIIDSKRESGNVLEKASMNLLVVPKTQKLLREIETMAELYYYGDDNQPAKNYAAKLILGICSNHKELMSYKKITEPKILNTQELIEKAYKIASEQNVKT